MVVSFWTFSSLGDSDERDQRSSEGSDEEKVNTDRNSQSDAALENKNNTPYTMSMSTDKR